jgi:hypothetical protein
VLKRDNKMMMMMMMMIIIIIIIVEALCIVKIVTKFSSTPCYFLRLGFLTKSDKQTNTQKEEIVHLYSGADKSLARPTSRCILFDGENISFDASLVIYINK